MYNLNSTCRVVSLLEWTSDVGVPIKEADKLWQIAGIEHRRSSGGFVCVCSVGGKKEFEDNSVVLVSGALFYFYSCFDLYAISKK